MSNIPEVDVQRRRKGEKPVRRAEAPVRRDSQGGQGASGGSSGGSFGSGGSSGGGSFGPGGGGGGLFQPTKGKMGCGGVVLLVVAVIAYMLLSGGGLGGIAPAEDQPLSQPQVFDEPTQVVATRTPRPTLLPSSGSAAGTWTVMLYQDADDQVLEKTSTST